MDTNAIIGLTIGIILAILFVAISIPQFRALKKNLKKEKEAREENNATLEN